MYKHIFVKDNNTSYLSITNFTLFHLTSAHCYSFGDQIYQVSVRMIKQPKFSMKCSYCMLHLVSIILMRGIQLKKNFSNWSYPVLTTTQNDEKLHIFYFDSLVILSIWAHYAWRDMYRWGEWYLNRSHRKLEWEHAVKLRNIQLLITSLVLFVT